VIIVKKRCVRRLESALALDVNLARAVDKDVADERIAKKLVQRSVAEDLVHHLIDQLLLLRAGEWDSLLPQQGIDSLDTLGVQLLQRNAPRLREVHRLNQFVMYPGLELQRGLSA